MPTKTTDTFWKRLKWSPWLYFCQAFQVLSPPPFTRLLLYKTCGGTGSQFPSRYRRRLRFVPGIACFSITLSYSSVSRHIASLPFDNRNMPARRSRDTVPALTYDEQSDSASWWCSSAEGSADCSATIRTSFHPLVTCLSPLHGFKQTS